MKIALIIAIIGAGIFLLLRYFSLKQDDEDKNALEEAYRKKDYDTYLAIINTRIERSKDVRDKNILATLKMPIYLERRDWEKMKALYKQVSLKKLSKSTKISFLCHYITGLYLCGDSDLADAFVSKNSRILKEAQENTRFQLYLDGFCAYQAYYKKDYPKARALFSALQQNKINNDFYQSVYREFLEKIDSEETASL